MAEEAVAANKKTELKAAAKIKKDLDKLAAIEQIAAENAKVKVTEEPQKECSCLLF